MPLVLVVVLVAVLVVVLVLVPPLPDVAAVLAALLAEADDSGLGVASWLHAAAAPSAATDKPSER